MLLKSDGRVKEVRPSRLYTHLHTHPHTYTRKHTLTHTPSSLGMNTMLLLKSARRVKEVRPSRFGVVLSLLSAALNSFNLLCGVG